MISRQNAEAKGMSYEAYVESLDLLTAADIAAVLQDLNVYEFVEHLSGTARGAYYINEKIPFAINYVDSNYDVTHDNDGVGDHGSHVAGIATTNRFIPTAGGEYANALTEVSMQGVAPDAQMIVMKVFGSTGAYSFSFTLNNFGSDSQIYSIYGDFFTQNVITKDGISYADRATTGLNMGVSYAIEGGYISTSETYSYDLNGDTDKLPKILKKEQDITPEAYFEARQWDQAGIPTKQTMSALQIDT
jgi:hypothetical protein